MDFVKKQTFNDCIFEQKSAFLSDKKSFFEFPTIWINFQPSQTRKTFSHSQRDQKLK